MTKDEVTVPCPNCVLIAICRCKPFDDLLKDCKLARDTLYWDKTTPDGARSTNFGQKITMIRDILDALTWDVDINEDKDAFSYVVDRHEYEYEIDSATKRGDVIVPRGFKRSK